MEGNAGKLAKTIGKLMKTAGKTMKKQGTQPRTKKSKKTNCQLNSAPLKKMPPKKKIPLRMKFPTEWKNKIHVPKHQPGIILVKLRYNTGIILIANATLRE